MAALPEKLGAGFLFCCQGEAMLLLRNSKHNDKTWGLPGGNCEPGESMQQTAEREATEECGHLPHGLALKGSVLTRRGKRGQKHFTVVVAELAGEERAAYEPKLNREHTAWQWFSLEALRRSALSGDSEVPLHPVMEVLLHADETWQALQKCLTKK